MFGENMAFTGSLNTEARKVVSEIVNGWNAEKFYIGCSGNYTVEQLIQQKDAEIYSNDIALYSVAIGRYLTGQSLDVALLGDELAFMQAYISTPLDLIATLMLCTQYFQFEGKATPYHERMANHYRQHFPELHAATVEKNKPLLDSIKIKDFQACDVLDFARSAPDEAAFICYPPTYRGGYEKLYKRINQAFVWAWPKYRVFDGDSFYELISIARKKNYWCIIKDAQIEDLKDYLCAIVSTSDRAKPVYVYASPNKRTILDISSKKLSPFRVERLNKNKIAWPICFEKINKEQLDLLRDEYLNKNIAQGKAGLNIVLYASGYVFGACSFTLNADFNTRDDAAPVYLVADFAVSGTQYKRLSKLVLATVCSTEMKSFLEGYFCMNVPAVKTAVFSQKAVSMKYRGIFELRTRKAGQLNYVGQLGKWTLKEGFEWWMKNHSQA